MELLHSKLPTDMATKAINEDTVTIDKCITLSDYRVILIINL